MNHRMTDADLAHRVLWDIRNSDGAHELARRVLARASGQSAPVDERRYWDNLFRAHVAIVSAIESRPRAAAGWLIEVELLEDAGVQPPFSQMWPGLGAHVITTLDNLQACTQ